jgi:hypothetical protein
MDQRYFEESEGAPPAHRQDDDGRAAVVSAFAAGFLLGATLALLWAPASGRDTRHWIQERGQVARRRTAEFLEKRWQALQIIPRRGIVGLVRRRRTSAVLS